MRGKQGFSLVELLVTMAIMAVVVGMLSLGIGMLSSADTKEVAQGLNSSLGELKSRTMGKNQAAYLHFYRYEDVYYVAFTDSVTFTPDDSGKEIGDGRITVSCDGVTMSNNADVCFAIRKKDGAFSMGPKEVSVTSEKASPYTVHLVKDTGTHYVE